MEEQPQLLIGLDFSIASQEVIEVLIEDASETGVFDEIARANTQRPEILKLLAEHPNTPEEVKKFIAGVLHLPALPPTDLVKAEKAREVRAESLIQKIQRLSVSARIQLALKGGREIRGILSRDPNKQVSLNVLENGKITESEIEMIAKSRQSLEDALRRIAKNREWMKNYSILFALVTNPKTPPGMSIGFVSELKTKDLILLEKNKNVAEAVRSAAKRVLQIRKPK